MILMIEVFGVCFDDSKKIYYFLPNGNNIKKNDFVIVNAEKGKRFGVVSTDKICINKASVSFKPGKVIRIATHRDIKINNKNVRDARDAINKANYFVKQLNLDMKILCAYFNFDRSQLLINFLADARVDFRELARRLAYVYKTRIELRQIGVRDKAKSIGGYGPCGRKLCCASFLDDISSVSINMAKNQNLALNPQKINGTCGRLMCCLDYENDLYKEYKKDLPNMGETVNTSSGIGKVVYVDIFERMYKVELKDGKIVEVMK
jgi:cell fate regulator YaaT (PSP1 superfamily)